MKQRKKREEGSDPFFFSHSIPPPLRPPKKKPRNPQPSAQSRAHRERDAGRRASVEATPAAGEWIGRVDIGLEARRVVCGGEDRAN